jgi:hypothetical protein
MRDFHIFDIPVYLCTEKAYSPEKEAVDVPREKVPPWYFNQVAGWIRLFVEGSRIGGYLWWGSAHRLKGQVRETVDLPSHSYIFADHITREDNSEKIFVEVLAQIEKIAKEPPLSGHYVDLRTFHNAGSRINWRELLKDAAREHLGFTMENTPDSEQETLDAMNQELARRLGRSGPHELESLVDGEHYTSIIESILTLFHSWRVEAEDGEGKQHDYN